MTREEAIEKLKRERNGVCHGCAHPSMVGWCENHCKLPEAYDMAIEALGQPEIIRCKDCIFYDPPHVENKGVRIEYKDLPKEAFDVLGTGLVSAEYGINIGGRCCVDYYCKNYSDDKRVYVREDNYCGRAERRTDE